MTRVVGEILPWLQDEYGAAREAEHLAFGGSSFGGICALWASMHYPHVFGATLVESPSLWFAEEKFLRWVGVREGEGVGRGGWRGWRDKPRAACIEPPPPPPSPAGRTWLATRASGRSACSWPWGEGRGRGEG